MSKTISTSSNIAVLDSTIVADLCAGIFYVDLLPSVFIGVGADNALGAKVRIINPFGVPIKDYASTYDIASPFTEIFDFPISTYANNYEYGLFTIDVQITDADDTTYEISKSVKLSYPDLEKKSRNYGSLGASIQGICNKNKVYVSVDSIPTYNGLLSESVTQSFTFEYPTGSSLPVATRTSSYFTDYLFEGIYRIRGEICSNYNGEDNIFYKVKYKVDYKKEILCQIDECAVFATFASLHQRLDENCGEEEREKISNQLLEGLGLFTTATLANDCGEDASDYIKALEDVLGCKCTCDFGAAPINNTSPASDIAIEGCGFEVDVNGLTKVYTINNYSYEVAITENGGLLTVSNPQLTGCSYKQTITFDISKVYDKIKELANSNNTEANFWASVINKAVTTATPPDGTTQDEWNAMTFLQRVQTIINAIAAVAGSIPTGQVNTDWDSTSGVTELLNKPTIVVYTSDNAITKNSSNFRWGGALQQDTVITGAAYKVSFLNGRVGIGMVPVFPLDIFLNDNNFNLGQQTTCTLGLVNGRARIGSLAAMQIFGGTFSHTNIDQVAGATGQLTFYNTGIHTLHVSACYGGTVGILIGYATGSGAVTGSVISALAAISYFGKDGDYDEAAGLRVNCPVGNGFIDAVDYSGTINNWYAIEIEAFNPASFPLGTIGNRWGVFQKDTAPNKFNGKITHDQTLTPAGTNGNVTINKPQGVANIAAGGTSVTITNSMITTTSLVQCEVGTVDATAKSCVAVEAAGSVTITLNAACTGAVRIKFFVH